MAIGVSSTCRCGGTTRFGRYSPPQAPRTSWAFRPLPDEEVVPSLPAVSTRLLGAAVPENPEHRPLRFRYSLPGTTRVVSLFEIFVPEFWKKNYDDGKFFKDRIVLVGATAERLHDFYLTPWGKLSGPEINLHALAAMLRGSWLKQAGLASTIVALVFAGVGRLQP